MSWLNNSLNNLKGQITNFAQEVLAEDPADEQENPFKALEDSQKKNEELYFACTEKDNEIAFLRKQIQELQAKAVDAGRSSKSPLEKNGSLEDSWCWEPENLPSDNSSKHDNGGATSDSSTGGDMITIPLDPNTSTTKDSGFVVTKLSKYSDDQKDQKLKKLLIENSNLNEKLTQLITENKQLNANLEELDSQHTIAIQNVLEIKNDLQEKYNSVTFEYKTLKSEHDLIVGELKNQLDNLQKKFNHIETAYTLCVEDNANLKIQLKNENDLLRQLKNENQDLHQGFDIKETELRKLILEITAEKETLRRENHELEEHLESEKISKDSLTKLQAENEDLQKQFEELQLSCREIVDEKKAIEVKLNELTLNEKHKFEDDFIVLQDEDVSSPTSSSQELIVDNEKLRNDYNNIEKQLENYKIESNHVEKELNDKIYILENEIVELKNRNECLSNECDELKLNQNQNDFKNLLHEKQQIEINLKNVQDNFLKVEKEKESLRKELEFELLEQNSTGLNEKQILDNEIIKLKFEIENLQRSRNDLKSQNDIYSIKVNELTEDIEKCEANASDVESKLMMENVDLQKQLVDMESSMNKSGKTNDNLINFNEIQHLFHTYLKLDQIITDKNSLEGLLKIVRDRIWKIDILEQNLKEMSNEVSHLIDEKSKIEHEKKTLQADVMHYEIECSELMKNNEILLNELENYKRNKLETIHENNEESIVILEKQLEDCNNLNQTLEDEYNEINGRLEEIEHEKQDHQVQIENLQEINKNLNQKLYELQTQIQLLEGDKCNLIFEINEMKTDDKKSAMESEILEYTNKIANLDNQLIRLNKDHSDLVAVMQSQQNTLIEHKKETDLIIIKLETQLNDKNSINIKNENDFKQLQNEMKQLQAKLFELQNNENDENLIKSIEENENFDKNIKNLNEMNEKLNTTIQYQLKTIDEQNERLTDLQNQLTRKKSTDEINNEIIQLNKTIEQLICEKNDLIKSITIKHNENTQYYMEIQRLSQLLQNEMEKSKAISCENCSKFENDFDAIKITNLNEIEKLKDQINFLREKSDILTSNLLSEQTNQKLLVHEKSEVMEMNGILNKDLERLRQHLVELEEAHTQELLEMQTILDETKAKMNSLENEVTKSSTAYTSASIRANQHAETLQAQYLLLTQQRDEIATKLSVAEDRESKNQAALVNLQCALEQFQKEKEKDILTATHRIRKELEFEQSKQKDLLKSIENLQNQLTDANQGLLAAARLSDQLEVSQVTIAALKEEIGKLQNKNDLLDEKLRATQSSQEDKIEKNLLKSLIIGYIVSSNQNDKTQILKMITSVLDFNQTEIDRIGLNKTQTGWLSSILNAGNIPNSDSQNNVTLAKAFVSFLEKESQPPINTVGLPNLLNIINENPTSTSTVSGGPSGTISSNLPERKLSGQHNNSTPSNNVQPILLDDNVMNQFAPTRNSSSILKDILNDS